MYQLAFIREWEQTNLRHWCYFSALLSELERWSSRHRRGFLFIFFYLWIKEAWACFLRLGSALAGVKSQINRSSNELPRASKTLRLCRPPLCRPVMDGCEHHSHISKKNGSDAIPVKEKHPLWWCIVVVWCSLLYLCLSSSPNCHRCLLLFGLPTATRTLKHALLKLLKGTLLFLIWWIRLLWYNQGLRGHSARLNMWVTTQSCPLLRHAKPLTAYFAKSGQR